MNSVLKKSWPISTIALLIIIFFYKILFFKYIYLFGDLHYFYSIRHLISSALKSSYFPVWTKYLTCGFPLMANPEAGLFDPINILLLYFLKPTVAFNALICIYFFIAGLFTFLFCRSIGLDPFSSLFSAIVFIFGGAFMGQLVHISRIFTVSFMPLIFWTINLFFKKKSIKFIFLTGLGIGLSFLPGNPQIATYVIFSSLLYFLFNVYFELRNNFKISSVTIYIFLVAIILILAFGISAVQNFPTKELSNLTGRINQMTYKDARNTSLYFQNFITYIFPFFFGMVPAAINRISYWGKGSLWELYIYMGILPFCLLFAVFGYLRDKRILFFLCLAVLSLLFALGKNSPVFFILFYLLPPLRYFKDPCKFVLILSFAMAILAGLGLNLIATNENLLKKMLNKIVRAFLTILSIVIVLNFTFYFCKNFIINGNKRIYLAFQGISLKDIYVQLPLIFFISLIIILWLRGLKRIKKEIFYALIIIVTFIDLFIINRSHNLPQDVAVVTLPPPSAVFLKKDKSLFRVFHIGPDFAYGSQKHVEIDEIPFFVIWGISSANFAEPLRIAGYNAVFTDINDIGLHKDIDIDAYLDRFGLFNVKYFTSTVKLKNQQAKLVFDYGVVKVYENPKVIPRIFFISAEKFIEHYYNGEVLDKNFVLNEFLKSKTELSFRPNFEDDTSGYNVNIMQYLDNQVYLDVHTDKAGFLVISDTYYPGWKVFVDEKKEEIIRANTIMRAVFIKEGAHKVRFLYDPASLKLGFIISMVSLIAVVLLSLSKIGKKVILVKNNLN